MKKTLGFSLIEILVAVVLLAIAALFLAKLSGINQQGTTQANERQVATRLAEGVMEQLRENARSKTAPTAGMIINEGSSNELTFVAGTNPVKFTASSTGKTTEYTINILYAGTPSWSTDNNLIKTQVEVLWVSAASKPDLTDATGIKGREKVVLVSNIAVPPTGVGLAAPAPTPPGGLATICGVNWNNSKCYAQGTYRRHGNDLYFCKAVGGCMKDAHNNPPAKPDEWVKYETCPADSHGGGGGQETDGVISCDAIPTAVPTGTPTGTPTTAPTTAPTGTPTAAPSAAPTYWVTNVQMNMSGHGNASCSLSFTTGAGNCSPDVYNSSGTGTCNISTDTASLKATCQKGSTTITSTVTANKNGWTQFNINY